MKWPKKPTPKRKTKRLQHKFAYLPVLLSSGDKIWWEKYCVYSELESRVKSKISYHVGGMSVRRWEEYEWEVKVVTQDFNEVKEYFRKKYREHYGPNTLGHLFSEYCRRK